MVFAALAANTLRKQRQRAERRPGAPSGVAAAPSSPSQSHGMAAHSSHADAQVTVAPLVLEKVLVHEGRAMPSRSHQSRPQSAANGAI